MVNRESATIAASIMILSPVAFGLMFQAHEALARHRAEILEPIEQAPVVVSGNHVYVAWFTNEDTVNSNFEVGFRASNDSGATFGPITNLSNTANSDSINAEIAAQGKTVIVSWWEKNQTSMVPVARVSTDNGQTFGPRLNITANPFGTIGRAEGK
jgi:predicted oxidoreductase